MRRSGPALLAAVAAVLVVGAAAVPAGAATYNVTLQTDPGVGVPADCPADPAPPGPNCELRDAVAASNVNAGSDVINLPAGTYTLTAHAFLNVSSGGAGNLTINGVDRNTTIIDGDNATGLFDADDDMTLNRLTLQRGRQTTSGGAALAGNGEWTLNDCVVRDNVTTGLGSHGAIRTQSGAAALTVTNCVFTGNTITSNDSAQGGAIRTDPATTNVTITGSTFTGNSASGGPSDGGGGGAVYLGGGGTIAGSTFSGNSALATAGGNTIAAGGAIYFDGSTTISDTVVTGNKAQAVGDPGSPGASGGGIFMSNGPTVSLTGLTVSGNSVISAGGQGASGGGMALAGATPTFERNTVFGNTATASGAGTFAAGGGVVSGNPVTIANSTISGNTAGDVDGTAFGGGFAAAGVGGMTLQNSTFAGNSVTGASPSGGSVNRLSAISSTNTIITGGTPTNCPTSGAAVTGTNNIDSDGTCLTGGTNANVDPQIGALLDNGGPLLTRAPQAGSPAIDTGSACAATDQRGIARPQGTQCDIGAVEVVQSSDLGVTQNASHTTAMVGEAVTYTITVAATGSQATDATQPVVTSALPAGSELIAATPSQGSCTATTTTVTCPLGALTNGGNATVAVSVRLREPGANVNTATVTSPRPDANSANDTSTATIQTTVPGGSGPGPVSPSGGGGGGGAGPPAGGPGGGADLAPVFTRSLRLSPASFVAAKSGASVRKAASGTRVTYSLSEAASVTFTVERATTGRRVGRNCVKQTRRNRNARKCTRYVRVRGTFRHTGKAGANAFRFTGRVGNRRLAVGKYRLVAVARDTAGQKSREARANFRVKRR